MLRSTRSTQLLGVPALVIGIVGLLVLSAAGPAGAAGPGTDFTWSMAPRAGAATIPTGADRVALARELHDPSYVQAKKFTVLLDACKVAGRGPRYVWSGGTVAPRPMPKVGREVPPLEERLDGTCLFRAELPQGTRQLTVRVADGRRAGATVTKTITVRDYLIVSIGDSAGAGEGSPDVVQQFDGFGFVRRGPLWKQRPCHRSMNAASAQAALQIERDPRTSVTFVHLACSGARIGEGLLAKYDGNECCQHDDRSAAFGQLKELKEIVGERRIDALLISIGVNDIGFGQIGGACVRVELNCAELEGPVSDRLNALWNGTGGSYSDLKQGIKEEKLNVAPAAIHLTEYPDITTDADGSHTGFTDHLLEMTQPENAWAAGVVERLNAKINGAARGFGWDVVDGATAGFRRHGLSSKSARWANTPFDSVLVQGPWPQPCPLIDWSGAVSYSAIFLLTGAVGTLVAGAACYLWESFNQAETLGPLHPNPRGYQHLGGLISARLLAGARIVEYTPPTEAVAGSPFPVLITLANTGILEWLPGEVALGASGGTGSDWGVQTIPLPGRVAPGGVVTLSVTLTAPATPDEYSLGWQLRRGGVTFGQGTGLQTVTVLPGNEPVCVTLRREQSRIVTRIRSLELELARITPEEPTWKSERFRVNSELKVARTALAMFVQQLAEQSCP